MRQILFVFLLFAVLVLLVTFNPLYASSPAKQQEATVTECILVSKMGDFVVYRCEDYDRGIYFYMNNYGFMLGDNY